jgi:hypothetical protein
MVVTVSLHLYFIIVVWGKERGLYLPYGLCQGIQGLGASFRLVACKSGGCSLLPVGAIELMELVLPLGWCL